MPAVRVRQLLDAAAGASATRAVGGMTASGWTMAHATYDDAYPRQPRSGCTGTFRVSPDDTGAGPVWLECDVCRLVVTMPRAAIAGDAPARPTEQLIPDTPVSAASSSWPF
jgi:hypothetical protein